MRSVRAPRSFSLSSGRAEAFSDGVFAIAATLLVLTLQLPRSQPGTLLQSLLDLWPSYAVYGASFITIGVMWMNHHALFARVSRVDRSLMLINLAMLGFVAFLPFPTQVLGTHLGGGADATVAAIFYAITGVGIACGFGGVYLYIGTHSELLHERFVGVDFLGAAPRFLIGTVAYIACIPLAFWSPPAVIVVIVAVILYYAVEQLPGPSESLADTNELGAD